MNRDYPWFPFYPKDYLSDPQLSQASHTTKGVWVDVLCIAYFAPEPGCLIGTSERLIRAIGCPREEFADFVKEARELGFANIRDLDDGRIEIVSRRMQRDELARRQKREGNANRQRRRRRTRKNAAVVTEDVTASVTEDVTALSAGDPDSDPRSEIRDAESHPQPETEEGPRRTRLVSLRQESGNRRGRTSRSAELARWFHEEFELRYPEHRRIHQKAALAELRKIKPDSDARQMIIVNLGKWAANTEWTKDRGQFVPGMDKFFSDGWYRRQPRLSPTSPCRDGESVVQSMIRVRREQEAVG